MRKSVKTQDMLKSWETSGSNTMCFFFVICNLILNHTFFECDYTRHIWLQLFSLAKFLEYIVVGSDMVKKLVPTAKSNNIWSIVNRLVMGASVYYVWQERNNRLFKRGTRSGDQLFRVIYDTLRLKISSLRVKDSKEMQRVFRTWKISEINYE